jgi:hypothetical protein
MMQTLDRSPSCRACARFDSDDQWRTLELVRSMGAGDLVPAITTRWTDRVVEVRKCPRCRRSIARLVTPQRSKI